MPLDVSPPRPRDIGNAHSPSSPPSLVVHRRGLRRGRRLVRRLLQHARDGVPAGGRPADREVPDAVRRHRDARLRGRSFSGGQRRDRARPGRRSSASRTSPACREPQLSRDGRIGFLTVQYDKPAQDLQRAPGERLEAVSEIGEAAGPGGLAPRPDRRPGRADERADRRADRPRGRDPRADARLPQRRRDAADPDREPDRAGRRHPAAAVRLRVHRLPELRPDARRDARPRRGDRLRAADRRPLPRAARQRATTSSTARGSPTPRRERASSRRARSSSSRSPACSRPGSRSSGAWASARRSSWPRSPSAPSPSCRR